MPLKGCARSLVAMPVLAGLAACSSPRPIQISFPRQGGATEILAVEQGDSIAVYLHRLDGSPLRVPLDLIADQPARLEALIYPVEAEALGFAPGPLPPAEPGALGFRIPASESIFRADLARGESPGWFATTTVSRALSTFLIAAPSAPAPEGCANLGGCLDALGIDCKLSCDAPPAPAEPQAPAQVMDPIPPQLTPCRAGWRQLGSPIPICEPDVYAYGSPACPVDAARFIGSSSVGCTRVGSPCAADGWPELSVLGSGRRVLYVLAGAAPGGTGTSTAPFARIAEALAAATASTAIALSGRFGEPIDFLGGPAVTLIGACTRDTVLEGINRPALAIFDGQVELRNMRLASQLSAAIESNHSRLILRDVVIDLNRQAAIHVSGGSLRATNLVVRKGLIGLELTDGATASVDRAVFIDLDAQGVLVHGRGTSAMLDRLALIRVGGIAIEVADAAALELSGSVMDLVRAGLSVSSASLTATDLVVRHTSSATSAPAGYAALAELGAALRLSRVYLVDSANSGIVARDPGTTAELADVVESFFSFNRRAPGIAALNGARLRLIRGDISLSNGVGVEIGEGAHVELQDLNLANVRPQPDQTDGLGILLGPHTETRLSRVRIQSVERAGLRGSGPGLALQAEDLGIADVKPGSEGRTLRGSGVAIDLDGAFTATLSRAALLSADIGLHLSSPGSRARIEDLTVSNVGSPMVEKGLNRALIIEDGATLLLARALMRGIGVGISLAADGPSGARLLGAPVSAEISDLDLEGVTNGGLLVDCVPARPSCAKLELVRARLDSIGAFGLAVRGAATIHASDLSATRISQLGVGGFGVRVTAGGALVVTRFRLSGNADAGAEIDPGSSLELSEGVVGDQPVGVIAPSGYDWARVMRVVRYERNVRPFLGR